MAFDPNSLFYWMAEKYSSNKTDDNKIIFCNEGSSRSSKTFDAFHLIYAFCSHNAYLDRPLRIGVFRNTLKDCREKTYDKDFKDCSKIIGFWNQENAIKENTSPEYILFGNKIEFRGLDNDSEASAYDIVFVNESLEVEDENKISGLKMRCRKLMIFDWNPKYTIHWIFEWEGRPFVYFSKTTYKNNKHLENSVIADIESKSPWHLDDLHLPENERRPHEDNIKYKTADEWYFKVYGMGERANRDGLIYPNVTWIEEFPKDYERIGYAADLGFTTSPTALTRVTVIGNNLYAELLTYEPTEKPNDFAKLIDAFKLKEENIWCDSAHPLFISALQQRMYNIHAVRKTPIMDGVGLVKNYKIHIVDNKHAKKEQENYAYRTINGIAVDEPIKGHDHFWDSLRYNVMANFPNHGAQ